MKWINHSLIAGSLCAVVSPPLVAPCVLGATAPDWMEWVAKAMGIRVRHRHQTHIFTHWLCFALFATFLFDFNGILAAFAWGGVCHILTDAMTVTGVPFSPYSDRRFHLFGGRFRTGDPMEYAISGIVVMASILLIAILGTGGSYIPFFPDWATRYEVGLADAVEWKNNRFRFF